MITHLFLLNSGFPQKKSCENQKIYGRSFHYNFRLNFQTLNNNDIAVWFSLVIVPKPRFHSYLISRLQIVLKKFPRHSFRISSDKFLSPLCSNHTVITRLYHYLTIILPLIPLVKGTQVLRHTDFYPYVLVEFHDLRSAAASSEKRALKEHR